MKKIIIFFAAITMLSIVGCKKSEDASIHDASNNKFPDFLEIIDFGRRDWDGFIAIQNYKGFDDNQQNSVFRAAVDFKNPDFRNLDLGDLSIGSLVLTANNHYTKTDKSIRNIFGATNAIRFNGSDKVSADRSDEGLYVPLPLVITSPSHALGGTNTIGGNITVQWNADLQNTLGVIVIVEFNPWDMDNKAMFNGMTESVKRIFVTQDDGSHTFNLGTTNGLPSNAKIHLSLIRGNLTDLKLKVDQSQDLKLAVYSYTVASAKFTKI